MRMDMSSATIYCDGSRPGSPDVFEAPIRSADTAMYSEKIGNHAETHDPRRPSADPPTDSADVEGENLEPKRTRDKRESAYSFDEDAFTNEGAPPPSAPHMDFTGRNSK
jgi:hypothetical protein